MTITLKCDECELSQQIESFGPMDEKQYTFQQYCKRVDDLFNNQNVTPATIFTNSGMFKYIIQKKNTGLSKLSIW